MFRKIIKLIEAWQNRRRREKRITELFALLREQQKDIAQTMQKLATIKKDYQ